jgi:disulfide bond formation protein DsbB
MSDAVAMRSGPSPSLQPATMARLVALLLPLALLAGAFGSQYFGGLIPCEMCWWQREAHMVAVVIALSGAMGVYHAGVEAKIFAGFTQCTALPKAASTAELLKQITHAPLVRCDEVQFRFLGISMAGWNAILSLGGAALVVMLALRAKRA